MKLSYLIDAVGVLGGTGYAVLVLGSRGWWFLPLLVMSCAVYWCEAWKREEDGRC